jgi:S1-C subfamily serine protease
MGQPNGQINAITFGKVTAYDSVRLDESSAAMSNITFPVINHDAPTDSGSSGGAVLNNEFKLAGVHYAGPDTEGFNEFGFAVPIEKVREYLNSYVHMGV